MKNNKFIPLIFGIIFVIYNFLTFFIGGLEGHNITFWVSYFFVIISFIIIIVVLSKQNNSKNVKKVFFLGYPIMIWSFLYAIMELVVSTIFMFVDDYLKLAVTLQLFALSAFIIIVLFCFKTKESIENIQEKRSTETSNMKSMIAEMKIISSLNINSEYQSSIEKLIEELEYSDIVSSEETLNIENKIKNDINLLRNTCESNQENIPFLIEKITKLISERNIICINNKKRF